MRGSWFPLPSPPLRGRGVGGEGVEASEEPLTPDPSPLSTGARGDKPRPPHPRPSPLSPGARGDRKNPSPPAPRPWTQGRGEKESQHVHPSQMSSRRLGEGSPSVQQRVIVRDHDIVRAPASAPATGGNRTASGPCPSQNSLPRFGDAGDLQRHRVEILDRLGVSHHVVAVDRMPFEQLPP